MPLRLLPQKLAEDDASAAKTSTARAHLWSVSAFPASRSGKFHPQMGTFPPQNGYPSQNGLPAYIYALRPSRPGSSGPPAGTKTKVPALLRLHLLEAARGSTWHRPAWLLYLLLGKVMSDFRMDPPKTTNSKIAPYYGHPHLTVATYSKHLCEHCASVCSVALFRHVSCVAISCQLIAVPAKYKLARSRE